MEYSIQQLSRLAGVSTRTLRWYDSQGLLKPSRVADSGYRYYGPAQVDRLQDILFYRALGVGLARIRESLDNPSFDRLSALRGHLSALEVEQARIQGLIDAVKATIRSEEREEIMNDEAKFQAFKDRAVAEHEARYGREVREKYGDGEADKANAALRSLTREQYQEWERLGREILDKLALAVGAAADPAGEEGRELVRLHRRWLTITGNRYEPDKHKGLAQLYVEDARFTAYYDRERPGCARFLRDAILHWAEQT